MIMFGRNGEIHMDLNILISTVVTATAALIAIIGGFLISRVITLSSEQSGIRRRLREIKLDIQAKTQLLEEVEHNLLEEDRVNFIESHYEELIFNGVSLLDILKREDGLYKGRTLKDLEPAVEELKQINTDLRMFFQEKHVEYSSDLPKEFNDVIKAGFKDMNGRKEWYEMLYDEHYYRLPEQPKTGPFGFPSIPTSAYQLPPNSIINPARLQVSLQSYEQKRRDRDTYQKEVTFLVRQEEEQSKILTDFGKPHGMWGGLLVLVYASIVGIVYPVTLLPYPLETYDDERTKVLVLLLFFSQLIALFIYLGINMRFLTEDEK